MNYSSHHKVFAFRLNYYHNINYQDVLNHPENYLGPNYKEVLNLWFYWESWGKEQWDVYWRRYWALDRETIDKAYETSRKLASEVIGSRFVDHLGTAQLEIIAAHIYIERCIPFTFLQVTLEYATLETDSNDPQSH